MPHFCSRNIIAIYDGAGAREFVIRMRELPCQTSSCSRQQLTITCSYELPKVLDLVNQRNKSMLNSCHKHQEINEMFFQFDTRRYISGIKL